VAKWDRRSLGDIDLAIEVTYLKESTLYALVHRRGIPFFEKGKKLYFKREELETWIEAERKATAEKFAQEAELIVSLNYKKK
jgi:excisionase family DNA binding protein